MKRTNLILLSILIIISFLVTGCTESENETAVKDPEIEETTEPIDDTDQENDEIKGTIKIGTVSNIMDAVYSMEDSLKEQGYEIDVVVFEDIIQPNIALEEGSLDAVLYQHETYLNAYNEDHGTNFYYSKPIFGGFTGLYSEEWDDLNELPEGAQIGIFNDASNQHRALKLAQENNMITLDEKGSENYHLMDIVENPNNYEFITLDFNGLVTGLSDLDACFVQASAIFKSGKDPTDYLVKEEDNTEFGIGLVTRDEDKNEAWINEINEAYQTEDTKIKFDEVYQGSFGIFEY